MSNSTTVTFSCGCFEWKLKIKKLNGRRFYALQCGIKHIYEDNKYFIWYHFSLRDFKASDFAKEAKELKELRLVEEKELLAKSNQSVEIRELFSVSGKTIPFFTEFQLRFVIFIKECWDYHFVTLVYIAGNDCIIDWKRCFNIF